MVLAMMEMVLPGVSTRKGTKITEELCGTSFSKSTVSRLCADLDTRVSAWKDRPLEAERYPFVLVDAIVVKVRRQEAVRPTSVLIALGSNETGPKWGCMWGIRSRKRAGPHSFAVGSSGGSRGWT